MSVLLEQHITGHDLPDGSLTLMNNLSWYTFLIA